MVANTLIFRVVVIIIAAYYSANNSANAETVLAVKCQSTSLKRFEPFVHEYGSVIDAQTCHVADQMFYKLWFEPRFYKPYSCLLTMVTLDLKALDVLTKATFLASVHEGQCPEQKSLYISVEGNTEQEQVKHFELATQTLSLITSNEGSIYSNISWIKRFISPSFNEFVEAISSCPACVRIKEVFFINEVQILVIAVKGEEWAVECDYQKGIKVVGIKKLNN